MQFKLSKDDNLKKDIEVTIPSTLIEERLTAHLETAAKNTTVPGFRPGKVPLAVMKTKYGEMALEKSMDKLIQEGTQQALDHYKIRPAMQPSFKAEGYEPGKDFSFTISVDSLPEIAEVDVAKLALKRYQIELEETKLEETIGLAQREFGNKQNVNPSRAAKDGDFVMIDFKGFVDGKQLEGGTATDYELQLGSRSFIEGFEAGLVGLNPGDTTTLDLKFPDPYHSTNLAGKAVRFDVALKAVQEVVAAPVDDDLAEKMGYETVAAMREGLKQKLEQEYGRFSRDLEKQELMQELDKLVDFPLPETMVDAEMDVIKQEIHSDQAGNKELTDAEKQTFRKEYLPIAERRVKLGLLLSDIARRKSLIVSQKELEQAVLERARAFPGQENQVIDYYNKNPQAVTMLRAPILEAKVVDYLIGQSQATPEKVTVKDLQKKFETIQK